MRSPFRSRTLRWWCSLGFRFAAKEHPPGLLPGGGGSHTARPSRLLGQGVAGPCSQGSLSSRGSWATSTPLRGGSGVMVLSGSKVQAFVKILIEVGTAIQRASGFGCCWLKGKPEEQGCMRHGKVLGRAQGFGCCLPKGKPEPLAAYSKYVIPVRSRARM